MWHERVGPLSQQIVSLHTRMVAVLQQNFADVRPTYATCSRLWPRSWRWQQDGVALPVPGSFEAWRRPGTSTNFFFMLAMRTSWSLLQSDWKPITKICRATAAEDPCRRPRSVLGQEGDTGRSAVLTGAFRGRPTLVARDQNPCDWDPGAKLDEGNSCANSTWHSSRKKTRGERTRRRKRRGSSPTGWPCDEGSAPIHHLRERSGSLLKEFHEQGGWSSAPCQRVVFFFSCSPSKRNGHRHAVEQNIVLSVPEDRVTEVSSRSVSSASWSKVRQYNRFLNRKNSLT